MLQLILLELLKLCARCDLGVIEFASGWIESGNVCGQCTVR